MRRKRESAAVLSKKELNNMPGIFISTPAEVLTVVLVKGENGHLNALLPSVQ